MQTTNGSECLHQIKDVKFQRMSITKHDLNSKMVSITLVCKCGEEVKYGSVFDLKERVITYA